MRWSDLFAPRQIRNRPRDLEHEVERPRGELKLLASRRRLHGRMASRVGLCSRRGSCRPHPLVALAQAALGFRSCARGDSRRAPALLRALCGSSYGFLKVPCPFPYFALLLHYLALPCIPFAVAMHHFRVSPIDHPACLLLLLQSNLKPKAEQVSFSGHWESFLYQYKLYLSISFSREVQ